MKIKDALSMASCRLSCTENKEMEARWMVESIVKGTFLEQDAELSPRAMQRLQQYLSMRQQGISLFRIIGEKDFHNITVRTSPLVFEPRWDSEVILDLALEFCTPSTTSILDLGTGTGCLLLAALKAFPHAKGIGVDLNTEALQIAKKNAQNMTLQSSAMFVKSHWATAIGGQFDLIISNPPYIPSSEVESVARICGDPILALDGGQDGMDCYTAILSQVADNFVPARNLHFGAWVPPARSFHQYCGPGYHPAAYSQ